MSNILLSIQRVTELTWVYVLLQRALTHNCCQDFDGFKDDTTAVDFLETGEDDDGNILVECSCADGLKGTFFNTYDFAAKF